MFTCCIAELFSFALFMENYIWKKEVEWYNKRNEIITTDLLKAIDSASHF